MNNMAPIVGFKFLIQKHHINYINHIDQVLNKNGNINLFSHDNPNLTLNEKYQTDVTHAFVILKLEDKYHIVQGTAI